VLSCAGWVFVRPEQRGKRTCGFVQRVPVGARRAISAQKKIDPETGRSQNPVEVGGLHQPPTPFFVSTPSSSKGMCISLLNAHGYGIFHT
jgi:hypothetical protein